LQESASIDRRVSGACPPFTSASGPRDHLGLHLRDIV